MIASLKGVIEYKAPDTVIIDVGGVGYSVMIPLSTYYRLPEPGEQTSLQIHTCIKDDAIVLNGFITVEEKQIFLHMISVTGIGPKLARNILSGISVDDFIASLVARDIAPLVKVPGLGKKTAERLILELSDKLAKLSVDTSSSSVASRAPSPLDEDIVSALINLGYKEAQTREALNRAKAELTEVGSFEELFKKTLKLLSSK